MNKVSNLINLRYLEECHEYFGEIIIDGTIVNVHFPLEKEFHQFKSKYESAWNNIYRDLQTIIQSDRKSCSEISEGAIPNCIIVYEELHYELQYGQRPIEVMHEIDGTIFHIEQ